MILKNGVLSVQILRAFIYLNTLSRYFICNDTYSVKNLEQISFLNQKKVPAQLKLKKTCIALSFSNLNKTHKSVQDIVIVRLSRIFI